MTTLKLYLAIAFLAIGLSFDNAWPGFGIVAQPDLSIEALILVAVGIFVMTRPGNPKVARLRLALLSATLALMVVLHYVNVTVSALFGRPFNLFWDGRHMPQVLLLAATNSSGWWVAATALAVPAGLVTLYFACREALTTVCLAAAKSGRAQSLAAALMAVATVAGAVALFSPPPWRDHIVRPLIHTYGKQALFMAAVFAPGATDRLLAPSPIFAGQLTALQGTDVMIVFSESYGVSTFEDPEMASALRPTREAFQASLSASRRHAASALVVSPTFGGGSWLAHAALLSGVDMREAEHHELLLASKRPTLVKHFKSNGYRSIALMPGLRSDWPEGGFYGFDQLYDARRLDYSGPEFGFWRIPDQYSLGRLHSLELSARTGPPRLIVFPTITSHLPFDPVPPLANNWSFATASKVNTAFDAALDPAAVRASMTGNSDWLALREPYVGSMKYSLEWLSSYLRDLAPPDMLIIVIGDHQPAATVVGRNADWVVPIHIIASSADLIQKFVKAGFTEGLIPKRPVLGQMHELTPLLIRLFDASEPARVDVPGARPGG